MFFPTVNSVYKNTTCLTTGLCLHSVSPKDSGLKHMSVIDMKSLCWEITRSNCILQVQVSYKAFCLSEAKSTSPSSRGIGLSHRYHAVLTASLCLSSIYTAYAGNFVFRLSTFSVSPPRRITTAISACHLLICALFPERLWQYDPISFQAESVPRSHVVFN